MRTRTSWLDSSAFDCAYRQTALGDERVRKPLKGDALPYLLHLMTADAVRGTAEVVRARSDARGRHACRGTRARASASSSL